MSRWLSCIAVFVLTLSAVAAQALETPPAAVRSVVLMDVDLSGQPAEETRLWLPYPGSTAYQDVGAVRVATDADESGVYHEGRFGNAILYGRWAPAAASRRLSLSFVVQRRTVERRDMPATEAPWDPKDYAQWLAPTSLGPTDGPVAELAARITAGKHGVLAKARAIYDWICDNMYRDPATVGCGKGDVCALLKRPGGKCTDIHSVFVALARAAGVPAREVFGVRLGKEPVQDVSGWQHCWAEFYLPGYGWVPVDPADVRKLMLKKKLTLEDPETAELRAFFWGGWDPFRVRLALGRDLVLNPPQAGAPLNTFGYPYAEVGGKPLDFYDHKAFTYTLTTYRLTEDGYGVLDTASLQELRARQPELALYDARSAEEYNDVHIPGAVSLPVKAFAANAHLLPRDRSRLIVFYCNGVKCGKSRKAAKKALELGYAKVLVYAEGMPVWEEKGLPIVAGPDHDKPVATRKLSPAELQALMAGGNATVVDVRDAEEYAASHIPGAINLPLATLAAESGVLDKHQTIVVYCNGGGRSARAYKKLMDLGYKQLGQTLFADWQEAGLAVEEGGR